MRIGQVGAAQAVRLRHLESIFEQQRIADAVALAVVRAAQRDGDVARPVAGDGSDARNHRETFLNGEVGGVLRVLAIHRSDRLRRRQFCHCGGLRGYRDALRDDVDRELDRDLGGLARGELDVLVDLVEAELFGREDVCAGGQVRKRELAVVAGGSSEDSLVAGRLDG